eukprot:2455234-Alexandrium_andersonii.AAC.1
MSASLVGSEMCIRDSAASTPDLQQLPQERLRYIGMRSNHGCGLAAGASQQTPRQAGTILRSPLC